MDKSRSSSSKHVKKRQKKSSKKPKKGRRRSRDGRHNSSSGTLKLDYPNIKIVEYSDVSSEDFSAPEAGEIEDEEILSFSEKDEYRGGGGKLGSNGKAAGHAKRPLADIVPATSNSNTNKSTHRDSEVSRLNFTMSPNEVRKVIIGSPISSSMSSNSRSKLRQSVSPAKTNSRKHSELKKSVGGHVHTVGGGAGPGGDDSSTSHMDDDLGDDDLDDNVEEEIDENDEEEDLSDRRRRKSKKSKKKKNKKKKKKRRKSISSIESISDNDSMLEETTVSASPPVRQLSPWEKTYTPVKPSPMSPGPGTPPLRPSSTVSMYSDASHRRVSPLHSSTSKGYIASPHTPPLVPKKSYHSPIDVDQLSHSHHSHHYHHTQHHQPRSPPPPPNNRRNSKSPSKYCNH